MDDKQLYLMQRHISELKEEIDIVRGIAESACRCGQNNIVDICDLREAVATPHKRLAAIERVLSALLEWHIAYDEVDSDRAYPDLVAALRGAVDGKAGSEQDNKTSSGPKVSSASGDRQG